MTDWHRRFLDLACYISTWSKDRSTQVGCVIVGPHNEIRSIGYNGFARGVDDDAEYRHVRPMKYLWAEHAERNAIYNAVRLGVPLVACRLYTPLFPCMDCARAIAQVGIDVVISPPPDFTNEVWGEHFKETVKLFRETNIRCLFMHTTQGGE